MNYFWLALRYYATFRGRTNLKGFWMFQLIASIVMIICWVIPTIYDMHQIPAVLQHASTIANINTANLQVNDLVQARTGPNPWYISILSNFGTLFFLATLIPSLAICSRRLHDTDHSGALLWLMLLPLVGFIILLVFLSMASTPGDNRYGPNPNDNPLGTVI